MSSVPSVVYGPDYVHIEGLIGTGRLVEIGDKVETVFALTPMTPPSSPELKRRDALNEDFPDEPQVPRTLKLVFWVRDPASAPNYSKFCNRISIQKVLEDTNKKKYIPLLENAIFLADF